MKTYTSIPTRWLASLNRLVLLLAAAGVLLSATNVFAATTYTAVASGNWNVNTTWSPSTGHPVAGDTAIINNAGYTVTVNGTTEICTTLTITLGTVQNNGTLTVAGSGSGAGSIVQGANATLTFGNLSSITTQNFGASGNTVIYSRSASGQTCKSGNTYQNLTLSGALAKTLTGVTSIAGTLTMDGSCTATLAASSTIGNINLLSTYSGTLTGGATEHVTGNVTVTGGTFTLANSVNAFTVDGTTTVNGGTLDLNASSQTVGAVTIAGGTIQNGTLNGSSYAGQSGTVSAILAGGIALGKTTGGTLTLSGANTFTGGANLNGGILNAGIAQNGTTSGPLGASGTISFGGGTLQFSSASAAWDPSSRFATTASQPVSIDTAGQSITLATALTSAGGTLTKSGTGTLTLSGANSYSGATTVSAGTLSTTTASTGAGSYAVSDNATLGVSIASAGQSLNMSSLTLGSSAGPSTLNITLGANDPTATVITDAGALTLNGTVVVNVTGGASLTGATVVLLSYSSLAGSGSFTAGSLPSMIGYTTSVVNDTSAKQLKLVFTALSVAVQWSAASGNWDTTTANWQPVGGGSATTYAENSPVTFDDNGTGSGPLTVTLTAAHTPASVTVNNSAKDYVLTGSAIDGVTTLAKSGTSQLTLSGANSYSGATTISAGTVKLGNATALGTTAGGTTLSSGAVLDLNGQTVGAEAVSLSGTGISSGGALVNSSTAASLTGVVTLSSDSSIGGTGNTTLSGGLAGNFNLTKSGNGALTLSTAATRAGSATVTTTINGGKVRLSNAGALSTGTTHVTTINGGTLELTGTITKDQPNTLNNGATLRSDGSNTENGQNTVAASAAVTLSTVGASDVFTIGNAANDITGGSGATITIAGPGAVLLGQASDYTGNWNVSAGTLQLGAAAALGATHASTITLAAGATLAGRTAVTTVFTANPITITGSGTATLLADRSSAGASVSYTYGNLSIGNQTLLVTNTTALTSVALTITLGAVTLTGSPTFNVGYGSSGLTANNLSLGGISDGGSGYGITMNGSGSFARLVLTGAGTYSGGTIINSGLVRASHATAMGTGVVTINGTGVFNVDKDTTVSGLVINAPQANSIINNAAATATLLTIGASGISNAATALELDLGNGSNRPLFVGLGASQAWVNNGSGVIQVVNNTVVNNTLNLGAYTLTLAGSGGTTLGSPVVGTGGLINNAGTLTLNNNNTYSGSTAINAGTLVLGSSSALAASATTVAATATLSNALTATVTIGGNTVFNGGALAGFTADGSSSALGKISVAGNLTLNANAITVGVTGAALPAGTYRLLDCTGTLANTGAFGTPTITGTPLAGGYTAAITVTTGSAGHVDLVVVKATPAFSGLTASQSIFYGTANVTLSGTVSAGSVYPANGETVSVTINGNTQLATIAGGVGAFSVSFPTATIPPSPSAYTINYAYAGDANLNAAVNNTSTALTVTGVKVPNLTYTNAPGVDRIITLAEIQSAGLVSSQGTPTYSITSVSATSAGGTVIKNGGGTMIKYTNSPSFAPASDSFSYTVTDGTASGSGTVTLNFASVAGPAITPGTDGSGHAVISFHGIPGYSYHVQRATLLSPADWTNAAPVTLSPTGDGSYSWTNTISPADGFYRLSYP
ncbi:MAG: autotransporter-associated beta strand repeat-containing protein [Verrucomicrobiae bacterium]